MSLRDCEDRVNVLLMSLASVLDLDLMLTLQRTATEMRVILELEGVHKAGPSLMGDCLIHFIFIHHIKYLLCVRQCSFVVVIIMIMVNMSSVELVLEKGDT